MTRFHYKYLRRFFLFAIFCGNCFSVFSQDTTFIKVHFLYGSKPLKQYKSTEKKWFGGILGGHTGIEGDSGKAFSFELKGKQHLFSKKKKNSIYKIASLNEFWDIMGTDGDSVKKTTIIIPLTAHQKQKFDSITTAYVAETPYDYAVFGMRCGASTYEILAQLGLVKQYSFTKTYLKIFYPRKLRKRLLTKSEKNGWNIIRKEGSAKRKWERDV
jgi:hypothetical protein